jgi:hypothetical protein
MSLRSKLDKYPKWGEWKRHPKPEYEKEGQGRQCIFCSKWTLGKRFIQVNFFRGDDEIRAVCFGCRKRKEEEMKVIEAGINIENGHLDSLRKDEKVR